MCAIHVLLLELMQAFAQMKSTPTRKRVSRDDWLHQGLQVLRESGVESVKIEHLARNLGVAKTGFYWHFQNRSALLNAMLDYWQREYTKVVTDNYQFAALPAKERLHAISQIIAEHQLAEFDSSVRDWAKHDAGAAALLEQSYKLRIATIKTAFRELGFRGDELEMRTRLFVVGHSNEDAMFGTQTGTKASRLRRLRVQLLINPLQD